MVSTSSKIRGSIVNDIPKHSIITPALKDLENVPQSRSGSFQSVGTNTKSMFLDLFEGRVTERERK